MNKVGIEIIISYSEFGLHEKVSLAQDEILDWYRVFRATKEPVFAITASMNGGGMEFLIAGQNGYSLKSMAEDNLLVVLPVTAESKLIVASIHR